MIGCGSAQLSGMGADGVLAAPASAAAEGVPLQGP